MAPATAYTAEAAAIVGVRGTSLGCRRMSAGSAGELEAVHVENDGAPCEERLRSRSRSSGQVYYLL